MNDFHRKEAKPVNFIVIGFIAFPVTLKCYSYVESKCCISPILVIYFNGILFAMYGELKYVPSFGYMISALLETQSRITVNAQNV